MRIFEKRWFCGSALLVAICFAPICRAEVVAPPSASSQIESLRLPSFSIFGFGQKEFEEARLNSQMPAEELEQLLQAATEKIHGAKKTTTTSFVIPLVMFRSRRLFAQSAWSTPDKEEGRRISRFFARLMKKPELEIFSDQPGAFRDGLINLRNWYADLCRRNATLSKMIFTFDDGPYFGFPMPRARFSELRVLQTSTIPGRKEKFALLTDGEKVEPFFIGVLKPDNSILWATRFSKSPGGTINDAELFEESVQTIKDYGFVCGAGVSGEASRIYLDQNLKLRFYFVSW